MTRVYVAAASAEIDRAERFIAAVRDAGHEVTFDWPPHVRESIRRFGNANEGMPRSVKINAAAACATGVDTCMWFVFLEPIDPAITRDGWVEFGIALASKCASVLWVGTGAKSIFSSLADHTVPTDADALRWLASMEGKNG